MQLLVSGYKGLVGTALNMALAHTEHSCKNLVRRPAQNTNEVSWSVINQTIESEKLEGVDAVVHLAGENIVGRWTQDKKKRIRDSRVQGTRFLSESLANMKDKPKVLVCASAIGYYGDRGDTQCVESTPAGTDFLSEVCQEWEDATSAASQAGIRVVNLRIGVVLSAKGGALQKMLPPFKLGLGGPLGNGEMYWSWVSIDDVAGAILHCIKTPSLSGPVNATAPEPQKNKVFTQVLAKTLKRPAIFPVPQFAARLLMGEMADALLFASTRVIPQKLLDSGYVFKHPQLHDAMQEHLI